MTRRTRAFRKPSPQGWLPADGEEVYLPLQGMGKLKAFGIVEFTVSPCWAVVRVTYGRYVVRERHDVADLRPITKRSRSQPDG